MPRVPKTNRRPKWKGILGRLPPRVASEIPEHWAAQWGLEVPKMDQRKSDAFQDGIIAALYRHFKLAPQPVDDDTRTLILRLGQEAKVPVLQPGRKRPGARPKTPLGEILCSVMIVRALEEMKHGTPCSIQAACRKLTGVEEFAGRTGKYLYGLHKKAAKNENARADALDRWIELSKLKPELCRKLTPYLPDLPKWQGPGAKSNS